MHTIPDVHCHLEALPDPEREVQAAMAAGVGPRLKLVQLPAADFARLAERAGWPDHA